MQRRAQPGSLCTEGRQRDGMKRRSGRLKRREDKMKFFYFKGLVQWGKKKRKQSVKTGLKFDDARLISAVLQTEVLSC